MPLAVSVKNKGRIRIAHGGEYADVALDVEYFGPDQRKYKLIVDAPGTFCVQRIGGPTRPPAPAGPAVDCPGRPGLVLRFRAGDRAEIREGDKTLSVRVESVGDKAVVLRFLGPREFDVIREKGAPDGEPTEAEPCNAR